MEKTGKKEKKDEKKPRPWAKMEVFPLIDKPVKEAMGSFFLEFFSTGGVLILIMIVILLKILEAFGLIVIKIPFL